MSSSSATNPRPSANAGTKPIRRRGLLAAMVALVAGIIGKVTERPVSAGTDGDVVLGAANTETTTTAIFNIGLGNGLYVSKEGPYSTSAILAEGPYGVWAIEKYGTGEGIAVRAQAKGFASGVAGDTHDGIGVFGLSNGNGNGVRGFSTMGVGVVGESTSGYPMLARFRGSSAQSTALYALNDSRFGEGTAGAGGFAMYGLSLNGHGVVGASTARGAAGIVGATNGVAGTAAGAFFGQVFVRGDFTVAGGAKSAAVPHPDGTHRRLYCLESPESWFEDFGRGQLTCGHAEVTIDPDFAALVDLSDYHVFLTEHDTHQHVIVKTRTAMGFTVEADAQLAALKGTPPSELNGAFSWRVVARRKDIPGERLASVAIPEEPTLPDAPPPPPPMPALPTIRPA